MMLKSNCFDDEDDVRVNMKRVVTLGRMRMENIIDDVDEEERRNTLQMLIIGTVIAMLYDLDDYPYLDIKSTSPQSWTMKYKRKKRDYTGRYPSTHQESRVLKHWTDVKPPDCSRDLELLYGAAVRPLGMQLDDVRERPVVLGHLWHLPRHRCRAKTAWRFGDSH